MAQAKHPSPPVECGFEEFLVPRELTFPRLSDVGIDVRPHIGNQEDVSKRRISAEIAEHAEVSS